MYGEVMRMSDEPPIAAVIHRYFPDWGPPANNSEWCQCLCPFHGESNPSAAVSFDNNAFKCFACGVQGDVVSIIRHQEEVNYAEAFRIAESLSVGGSHGVQGKFARKPSRRVFGEPGDTGRSKVRAGVRGRSTPWA